MISRRLMIADSNGRPQQLPGDTTSNPNNPVFEPFDRTPIVGKFASFHVSEESLGFCFVTVWLNNELVAGPLMLHGGKTYNIKGDKIQIEGVRRAGEMWLELSDNGDGTGQYTRTETPLTARGAQLNIYPLMQVALYVGGPASNLWCHPNSAPGAAAPMVMGSAMRLSSLSIINRVGYTSSYWDAVFPAVFNVDPDTQSIVNVRRLSGSIPTTAGIFAVNSFDFNPWDRAGIVAIPSATNPGGVSPATVIQFMVDGYNTFSRKAEFGYLGMGSGSVLV